ncbi:MAG TPA: hypothetical protein VF600_18410 [Abditibacteriaceae bacterium]
MIIRYLNRVVFSLVALHISFLCTTIQPACAQTITPVVPAESAMGRAAGSLQRVLLSPLEADGGISKAGWKMNNLTTRSASAEAAAKVGQSAVMLRGEAEGAGSKGDFGIHGQVPGDAKIFGMWIYLRANANVDKVGFQFVDGEGESFLFQVPANWQGWKWVEADLRGDAPTQAWEQSDKNKKVDSPLQSINVAWFSKAAGQSSLIIDALLAATTPIDTLTSLNAQPAWSAEISGAAWGETNAPLALQQIVLTNRATQPITARIEYSIQRDPALFSVPPPDPLYGSDHARGARSWTEANGKVLEEGSLSDGRDWTNAALPWGSHQEATQYIDLGRERTVSRLGYVAGDANWAWKVDFSASGDGKTYEPVAGLQDVDTHGKWGDTVLAPTQPFKARFLRLRHHNNGQSVNAISMPSTLSVYDGAGDEKWEFPVVGENVSKGSAAQTVPSRSFATLNIAGKQPLAPGAYLVAVRVQDGAHTQMLYRHYMVMPSALPSASDRFGLNSSNYLLAPLHRRLGIGWVRFENMKWPMISPEPNVYRYDGTVAPWNVPHDVIVSAYNAQGIKFLPFLFQTPDYATSAPPAARNRGDSYPPKDNTQMADFVFQTVARYGSRKHAPGVLKTADKKSGLNQINTFEIWNEPNLTDPGWGPWVGTTKQYNAMFRAAAEAVKRADPAARVTNGGFAGIEVETLNTLLAPYDDGKKPLDFVDVLNVHYYSGRIAPEIATNDPNADRSGNAQGARTFEDDLRRLIAWRDKNKPGTPIWMTETGYDSAGPFGTDEQTQAARLPRVIMMALAAGIEKVIVYREMGSTPSMHAASGVLRNDETLKPSWFTYATLIRQLNGIKTGAQRLPYPDANIRLYAWTRGTETILSAWAVEGAANLSLNLGNSTVTDAFGHRRQVNIAGKLPLSIYPVYIQKIGNVAGIRPLIDQAQRAEAARKHEQARLSNLRAYLFDFGSKDRVGTVDIGDTRTFTGILGTDIYDEARGYGFYPKAAGQDNVMGWINDPLERDSTRMNPDDAFRIRARPGHYRLRINITPQSSAQLTIKGAVGGDKVFPIAKDGPVTTTEIEVGNEPLLISNNGYGDIRWLELTQQPN